jgi:hypothetical protein
MNEGVLNNVFASLDLMWKGMLGLFLVCGVIALLTGFISKRMKAKTKS